MFYGFNIYLTKNNCVKVWWIRYVNISLIYQTNQKSFIMNYELKVTETKNKAGKFHYQVIDENGNIISERKSNKEYVACTANGHCYFGRLDLIGKGDNGIVIKRYKATLDLTEYPSTNIPNGLTPEQALENLKNNALEIIKEYTTIAYKK